MSSDKRETNATGQPDVRYVLSGQPTGWAAMAKEVRDFDEEKVQSCKEDIDTLLVFAGLFSAVLSAFLIAEYPSLQPDRTAMMMYTLERIASQTAGYNFADGKLVAMNILPAISAPFQPSAIDIRVNILWFSSLLLSLITASFGMLVKQWLREFLAVEIPSPQARLRLRHLREPQVKGWKVYEIAATLPLLLQLALALFFVGLCYFTQSIHSSVEFTTLPLVVAWALFFFAVTLLPLFFPLCPYKTTLLKTVFTGFHRALRSMATYKWTFFISSKLNIPDELVVVDNADKDVEILLSVDVIQASDELLGTSIAEALQYLRPDWKEVTFFVLQALSRRLETISVICSDRMQSSAIWPFHTPHPLVLLRPQTREAIIGILSKAVDGLRIPYTSTPFDQLRQLDHVTEGNSNSLLLCVFSIVVSGVVASTASLVPPGVLSFLRFYLTHKQYNFAICSDLLQLIYLPNFTEEQASFTLPESASLRLASMVTDMMSLAFPTGVSVQVDPDVDHTRYKLRAERMAMVSGLVDGITSLSGVLELGYETGSQLYDTFNDVVSQWTIRNFSLFVQDRIQSPADEVFEMSTSKLLLRSIIEDIRTLPTGYLSGKHWQKHDSLIVRGFASRFSSTISSLVQPVQFSQNEGRSRDLRSCFQELLLLAWGDDHATFVIGNALLQAVKSLEFTHWTDLFKEKSPETEVIQDDYFNHLLSFFLDRLCKPPALNDAHSDLTSTLELCYLAIIILASLKLSTTVRQRGRYLLSVHAIRLRNLTTQVSGSMSKNQLELDEHQYIHSLAQRCLYVVYWHAELRKVGDAIARKNLQEGFGISADSSSLQEDTSFSEQDSLFPDRLIEVLTRLDRRPWIYKMSNYRVFLLMKPCLGPKTTECASAACRWQMVIKMVMRLRRVAQVPESTGLLRKDWEWHSAELQCRMQPIHEITADRAR